MLNLLIIPLILASVSIAASPPILHRSLASQLSSDNPAISSAFLISSSSALLSNTSISTPALRVPPSWSFSIGFLSDTFLPADGHPLSFDAQLDTGDALPDWLHFARDSITFGGVTPKESNGVQFLNIVVTAASSSSSACDTFTLIVSLHDLSITGPLLTRNVTADTKFSFAVDDWQGVQVDGARVPPATSAMVLDSATNTTRPPLTLALTTAAYPWLAYDTTSRILSGTPPASYAGIPGPTIPARVTVAFPTQSFTVSTNLTLDIFSPAFTTKTLPQILVPPGSQVVFDLTPFLSNSALPSLTISARWNATWLSFNQNTRILNGTVPIAASLPVQVLFTAHDTARGTDSRSELVISTNSADGNSRTPTDRALRKAAKKVSLVIGLVCGIIGAVILLASFLALCRRFCTAHEHVHGAYVIDQSLFREGLKSAVSEKETENDARSVYLVQSPRVAPGPASAEGHTITKAAFFNAVRERLGNDGSWRGRRSPSSILGSTKRARKSKISKPMVVLSSSTSIHDGFADRARGGTKPKSARFYSGANFTIFGNKNNAHGAVEAGGPKNSPDTRITSPRGRHTDVSPPLGRALLSLGSSSGTAILAYDRSRSSSDPSQGSAYAGISRSPDAPRSGSAPSVTTGSHSIGTNTGTQSTFATGDSTRLTNAAGEVPFRRPGFDGRRETLAERHMREMGGTGRIPGHIFSSGAGDANALTLKAPSATAATPPTKPTVPTKAPLTNEQAAKSLTPPKSATPPKPSKLATPPKDDTSGTNRSSPHNIANGSSLGTGAVSTPGPSGDLPAVPSNLHLFSSSKNESDGTNAGVDDVEHAVIRYAVQHPSNESVARQGIVGKPRLVAFTHQRTPAPGQAPRRDVSQKVVVHSSEESDTEAELRIGLEYVRRLGHPEDKQDALQKNLQPNASTSQVSLESNQTNPHVEFYASNDSNGSIAGRTRVMSHLVINSHRHRHQTASSTESAQESFVSSTAEGEGRWMVEAELPHIFLGPGEPFNFAAPLDRAHKHASALAGSALQAKQGDGRALPEWLRFRNVEREFWGVSPKATNGETVTTLVTRVVVHIWDAERSEVVGGCLIDVLANE